MSRFSRRIRRNALIALIGLQGFCTVFFLQDILHDIVAAGRFDAHSLLESLAYLAMIAALAVEAQMLRLLLRQQALDARALSVAQGEVTEMVETWFGDWGLTAAEADVAMFTIKGFSISEIAQMRGSAEGTVKTHLNAIYRKAGVPGRAQLVSLVVEELMGRPLVPAARARPRMPFLPLGAGPERRTSV